MALPDSKTDGAGRNHPSTSSEWSLETAISRHVSRSADGRWRVKGKIVRCSLGGHESKARCQAMALALSDRLKQMSPEQRRCFIEKFNRTGGDHD